MNYLFLDTNIFIHFLDFDQIDWKSVIDNNEECNIIIAPSVLSELDKHKYNKNSKISRRVKRILPKIENYILNNEFPISLSSKPKEETFVSNSLDRNDQDDNILAAILEFKKYLSEVDNVFFISHDTGPRLKAKILSLKTFDLSNKYFIENEPDEIEIKNKELEKELKKFKNLSPDVKFLFSDKNEFLINKKKSEIIDRESFINKHLTEIKIKYPKIIKQTNSVSYLLQLTNNQIEDYNNKLEDFYSKYEKRFESLYDAKDYIINCIEIKLSLFNDGNYPAENIDVNLHFPDGFILHNEQELPKIIEKPKEPYKPKNMFDVNHYRPLMPINAFIGSKHSIANSIITNYKLARIKKTNSYNVDFHLDYLKHNQSFEFETLYLKYEDLDLAENFSIDYEIMISNFPTKIIGKLNVVVNK